MDAVDISHLYLTYPNGFQALKGIDLQVKKGDFFALLGPNGAGKTTLIGIMSHLLKKTEGSALVFGLDLEKEAVKAKSQIGIVPQEFNFNVFEKVEDILVKQAGFYGVSKANAQPRIETLLKKLSLWDKRHQKAGRLSGGMKRRLMIARALVHEPKLLILDEPTTGVDIELRKSTWEFLKELNQSGTTIILTTHYLEEAEILCNRIAIINHGKILKSVGIHDLLNELKKEVFIISLKQAITKELTTEFPYKHLDDTTIEVEVNKPYTLNHLFDWLSRHELESISIKNKATRLESLLLEHLNS